MFGSAKAASVGLEGGHVTNFGYRIDSLCRLACSALEDGQLTVFARLQRRGDGHCGS
jgi:hypothetical protein